MESERTGGIEVGMIPKVFVVSNERECRESLVSMLNAFHFAAASYESPVAFFKEYQKEWPGCLLLELSGDSEDEEAFLEELREHGLTIPVVIIAHAIQIRSVVRAMQLGALHLTETPYDPKSLRTWIQRGINLDAKRKSRQALQGIVQQQLRSLTDDEQQVLEGILSGWHNKVIASRLDIGVRTVQGRRAVIMRKLECQSVAKLVWKVVVARMNDTDEMWWNDVQADFCEKESSNPKMSIQKSR